MKSFHKNLRLAKTSLLAIAAEKLVIPKLGGKKIESRIELNFSFPTRLVILISDWA